MSLTNIVITIAVVTSTAQDVQDSLDSAPAVNASSLPKMKYLDGWIFKRLIIFDGTNRVLIVPTNGNLTLKYQ